MWCLFVFCLYFEAFNGFVICSSVGKVANVLRMFVFFSVFFLVDFGLEDLG